MGSIANNKLILKFLVILV